MDPASALLEILTNDRNARMEDLDKYRRLCRELHEKIKLMEAIDLRMRINKSIAPPTSTEPSETVVAVCSQVAMRNVGIDKVKEFKHHYHQEVALVFRMRGMLVSRSNDMLVKLTREYTLDDKSNFITETHCAEFEVMMPNGQSCVFKINDWFANHLPKERSDRLKQIALTTIEEQVSEPFRSGISQCLCAIHANIPYLLFDP